MNKRLESLVKTKNIINKSLQVLGFALYLYSSIFCLIKGQLPFLESEMNPFIWLFVVAPTALTMFTFFCQLAAKMVLSVVLMLFISKREIRYVLVENS